MRLAGGAERGCSAAGLGQLAGRAHRRARPDRRRRRPGGDRPLGLDPVRRRGAQGAALPRHPPLVLPDRAGGLRCRHRRPRAGVGVLEELGLTALVTSMPGLSAVGAATILAETGDPTRFCSARALVKHAGLCPATTPRAPTRARPGSAAPAAPSCAWPPGGRSGAPCTTTRSWPPATPTSPAAPNDGSPTPRPESRSPAACCASCTP